MILNETLGGTQWEYSKLTTIAGSVLTSNKQKTGSDFYLNLLLANFLGNCVWDKNVTKGGLRAIRDILGLS